MASNSSRPEFLCPAEAFALNGYCSGVCDADPRSLKQELSQLSLTPLPRAQLLQLASAVASSSPFSSPVPELVQALQDKLTCSRQMPACEEVPAPSQPQENISSKYGLSDTTSGVLTSCAALSVAANNSQVAIPPHGVKAVCGKRAKMEDTFNVQPNFANVQMSPADIIDFQNKLPARIASQVGEQLEQQTSPPHSLPLSPNSTCVPSLSSSDAEPSVGGSSIGSDSCDTLHFFGVYDGHGGVEAAQHCANRLHYHLSSAMAMYAGARSSTIHANDAYCHADPGRSGVHCQAEWTLCPSERALPLLADSLSAVHEPSDNGCWQSAGSVELNSLSMAGVPTSMCPLSETPPPMNKEEGTAAIDRLFNSAESADCPGSCQHPSSLDSCTADSDSASSGSEPARSEAAYCMSTVLENALRSAFIKTDEEFAEDGSAAMVGSTAVVALVGSKKMWIANCGDSRAVLCRGSRAIQVTDDHKPEREDEAERVEKAGGQVLYWNGHRVMGVLAMSRAIGDHGLRPYVIPEPEITVLSRVVEDDFLLLASDGLWDVMSNQEAITLAMRCLQRSWDKGTSRKAAVRVAATVLTRAAVDRGSKDNVTVVIIDLKASQPTSSDGRQENMGPLSQCDTSCPMSSASFTEASSLSQQDTLVSPVICRSTACTNTC